MNLKSLEEPIYLITKNKLNPSKNGNKEVYQKEREKQKGK